MFYFCSSMKSNLQRNNSFFSIYFRVGECNETFKCKEKNGVAWWRDTISLISCHERALGGASIQYMCSVHLNIHIIYSMYCFYQISPLCITMLMIYCSLFCHHFLSICMYCSDDCMTFLRAGFQMVTIVSHACIMLVETAICSHSWKPGWQHWSTTGR